MSLGKRDTQPIPQVSASDVERIVRRDFPHEQIHAVMAVLELYGVEEWERGTARVRLAALKLARGDLDALRREIGGAKYDYRDVLAAAEYPAAHKVSSLERISLDERQRIIDADWKQYQEWFERA